MDKKEMEQEELLRVSGGTPEQTAEILEYIRTHDPNGYAFIMNSKRQRTWTVARYLHDKGIPITLFSLQDKVGNMYMTGEDGKYSTYRDITHEELMAMMREKI